MKCPTFRCPEILPIHGRKKYCQKCRQSMYYWDKKTPAELIEARYKREKSLYRMTNVEDRKTDQDLASFRKDKREKTMRVAYGRKRPNTTTRRRDANASR
jgi:hypothetical protein